MHTSFHSSAVTGCTDSRPYFTSAISLSLASALIAASVTGLGIGSTASTCIPPILPSGQCTGTIPGTAITKGPGTTLGGLGRFLGLDLLGALDLAEQDGLLTTLAEPNLTALSGETASFLAGGEFPVVTSSGLNGPSVTYKPYGVSLSYTPVVLANGRISIRVKPEVSEIAGVTTVAST